MVRLAPPGDSTDVRVRLENTGRVSEFGKAERSFEVVPTDVA
ncbi:hypothetical protein [Streptomyces decoyicus]